MPDEQYISVRKRRSEKYYSYVYIENGTQLGWLIDRFEQKVYIYQQQGKAVEILNSLDVKLSGDWTLPGFTLDLGSIVK